MSNQETITITVEGLEVRAFHGVMPQERRLGNDFIVDVALDYPPALEAAATDCLDRTVNYARVVEIVREVMRVPSSLIEHVAWRIRAALLDEYPAIASGRVKVVKKLPPVKGVAMKGASVTLAW